MVLAMSELIEIYTNGGVLGLGTGPVSAKRASATESFGTLLQAIEALHAAHPDRQRIQIAIIDGSLAAKSPA